jgi:hypothetical protein
MRFSLLRNHSTKNRNQQWLCGMQTDCAITKKQSGREAVFYNEWDTVKQPCPTTHAPHTQYTSTVHMLASLARDLVMVETATSLASLASFRFNHHQASYPGTQVFAGSLCPADKSKGRVIELPTVVTERSERSERSGSEGRWQFSCGAKRSILTIPIGTCASWYHWRAAMTRCVHYFSNFASSSQTERNNQSALAVTV